MLLGKVLENIEKKYKNINFNNIRFNSKDCKKNDIFFAINGNHTKGSNYINNAIDNGHSVFWVSKWQEKKYKKMAERTNQRVVPISGYVNPSYCKQKPKINSVEYDCGTIGRCAVSYTHLTLPTKRIV